jgi:hypothetical protein
MKSPFPPSIPYRLHRSVKPSVLCRLRPAIVLIVAMALCGLDLGQAGEAPVNSWAPGFDKARQLALRSRKDILVAFTIRRMDAASRHFEEHFLTQPVFANSLTHRFEMVWVDASESGGDREDSPAFQLRRQFEVSSFPTVVLMNWLAQPYAYTGLRPGSLENYLEHLEQLRQNQVERSEQLNRARSSRGLARAELLAGAIPELGLQRSAKFYGDVMREILSLDPQRQLESTRHISRQLADHDFSRKLQELDRDLRWTEMVDLINHHIAEQNLTGAHRQAALMNRLDVHRLQDDLPRMFLTLQEIVQINPYSRHGQQASAILTEIQTALKNQATLANPEIEK